MPEYQVLRVFCSDDGSGGNPLAVFLDGASVAPAQRQDAARRIGFSETAFVDDPAAGTVRIFTPAVELPFAGHPLVGTAWLLAQLGSAAEVEALDGPPGGHDLIGARAPRSDAPSRSLPRRAPAPTPPA